MLVCVCLILQTYGIGGESLRSLTEKLRAVSHTLVMGIQGRWRQNNYDGRSATRLTVGVLQVVVELITSAKGLFTLLNRLGREGYLTVTCAALEESILFCNCVFLKKNKKKQLCRGLTKVAVFTAGFM